MDHRSLWNKEREARKKEEEIKSERRRGNEIEKGSERVRVREGGGRKTGRPGPPGQTIAAR